MNTPYRKLPARTVAVLLASALALSVAPGQVAVAEPLPQVPAGLPAELPAASSAFAKRLEGKYIDPDRVYSTDVRWWLGEASNTDESLLEEIQALYDAGFRGVELCMQADNAAPDADYAYGSAMWTHKWNLMMNKLLDLGMAVYLTSGTNWSTSNVPGLDPTSQAAMQNLTMGSGTVAAGESVSVLPAPDPAKDQRAGAKFVTAYAYRIVQGDTIDPDSYVNLGKITQGTDVWTQNVNWTAPDDGTYRIFGFWTQGTWQASSPSAETSYATNYFDERGVAALKTFWEDHYLKDPALVAKMKKGDVQLFMDSLEISAGGGVQFTGSVLNSPQFTWWAEDIAAQFKARKGYDIMPYMFLIRGVKSNVYNPYDSVATTGLYRIQGQENRRQEIINDWQDVLTELYMERMLTPLKTWLNSVGIKTRAQISYGKPLEISEPAMAVDYPEAENLNQYNQVDIFRLWTGAAKLENKVLSTETGAEVQTYNATAQVDLKDAYSAFAAGFQRIIWHVWGAGFSYGNKAWPGHNPTGFRHMGTRHPASANYDEFNAHLGRVQQLMQTGKSRTDVGFVHQNWAQGIRFGGGVGNDNTQMNWQLAHQGVYYRSTELQDNGYTYDYFSPAFLFDDDVSFNTTTKTIEKAGYKAIVLYQDWLDIDAAKQILKWAKKGLKVVVLEDAASRTPFNDGKDAALKKVMTELKSLSTVRTATVYDNIDYFSATPGGYDDNVMEKLQELGVYPTVGYAEANLQLLTQTRQDNQGNEYVFVYNYDDGSYLSKSHKKEVRKAKHTTHIATDLVKDGLFVPYVIDAWTGKVTEVAGYQWKNGKTILPIDLDYNNIELLAFEKVNAEKLHVLSTNAESSYGLADGVAARATRSGTVTTTLSNGKEYAYDVTVPSASDITGWDVTVESWRPNATAGDLVRTETIDGLTTTNYKTSTVKTPINVKLDKLTTWDKIPEVGKAVSGTGHYEASFNWDTTAASGAYLDFGDTLEESMKVWINGKKVGGDVSTNPTKVKKDVGGVGKATIDDGTGKQVPLVGKNLYTGGINWLKPIVDVSPYLVNGSNDIVIEYTSSLSNVQLDRGVATVSVNKGGWWKYDIDYLSFGPSQAKLVPFVDVAYTASLDQLSDAVASAEELVANVNSGMYTEATATAFLAALDAAKAVLADNQAADAQRTSVRTALESAVKALTIHVEMVVDRVKLNQSQLRLVKGKTLKLEEGVYFTNGTTAYAGAATWKSSNTKVATVTKDGKVKAKKPGTATITVTSTKANAAGKKVTAKVKVTVVKKKPKAKVTKVSASVPKTMAVGKTAYITGKYSSAKATGIKVTYKSSKTKVATIDKVGRIQAKAKGTVKITVKAGSKSKTYTVKVK